MGQQLPLGLVVVDSVYTSDSFLSFGLKLANLLVRFIPERFERHSTLSREGLQSREGVEGPKYSVAPLQHALSAMRRPPIHLTCETPPDIWGQAIVVHANFIVRGYMGLF